MSSAPTIVFEPQEEEALRVLGILGPDPVTALNAGQLLSEGKRRQIRVFDIGGTTWFAKMRRKPPGLGRFFERWRTGEPAGTAAREWDMLGAYRDAGITVPARVAHGVLRHRDRSIVEFVITKKLDGHPIASVANQMVSLPTGVLSALAQRTARVVARIHAAGLTFGGLQGKHVWCLDDDAGNGLQIRFLDLATGLRRESVRWADRVLDLATLHATLPCNPIRQTVRLRFLRAYLEESRLSIPVKVAASGILSRAHDFQRKRRYRVFLAPRAETDPEIVRLPGGDYQALRSGASALVQAGLGTVAELKRYAKGRIGQFEIRRGRRLDIISDWMMLRDCNAFGVPAPYPSAFHVDGGFGTLVFKPLAPGRALATVLDTASLEDRFKLGCALGDLMKRILRAGLVPNGRILDRIQVVGEGTEPMLAIDPLGVFSRPPKTSARRFRPVATRFRADLSTSPFHRDEQVRILNQIFGPEGRRWIQW
jgi:hypothetical protein